VLFDNELELTATTLSEECRTHNKRFSATAAGSADLKGSAGMPPLRQAACYLQCGESGVERKSTRADSTRRKNGKRNTLKTRQGAKKNIRKRKKQKS